MNLQDGTTQFKVRDARCHHALGEIVALIVTPPPYEHLVECNGQTLVGDEYAELIKALGTNVVPNLNGEGRFLQGSNTAGNKVEAGLPNITGEFSPWAEIDRYSSGAFFVVANNQAGNPSQSDNDNALFGFDASRCSSVYGRSSTVQPPAYTVKYYICYGE